MNRKKIQLLELFGGIGAPRCALRNIGVPTKSIDYVEIDEAAVRSYNAMFRNELPYKVQDIKGWTLRPDILVHGSPCQDFSIAGHQKGAEEESETRSSLMWETLRIIKALGDWKPKYVIWENVKNVTSKHMKANFDRYVMEMYRLGYSSSWKTLDARSFGLPQARERVFTISILDGKAFDFDSLMTSPMDDIAAYLQKEADPVYEVTQPSILGAIGNKGIRRATVIRDYAYTITTRQDRSPAQVVDIKNGRYRYLTEQECWRLMGFSDDDYEAAASVQKKRGRYQMALFKQAGNSLPVRVLESIFRQIV